MPFDRINYVMLLGAVGLIVLGYTVMLIDNAVSDNPVDSAISLYLAPLLLLGGYLGVAAAVLWGVPRESDADPTTRATPDASSTGTVAALVLALAVVGMGCGEKSGGIEIGEADGSAIAANAGADTDSLAADSSWTAGADSAEAMPAEGTASAAAESADFAPFWAAFTAAIESGNRTPIASLTKVGAGGISAAELDGSFLPAIRDVQTRNALTALSADDFERDGTRRRGTARMGFDGEGNPVPIEEADTESAIILDFDLANGEYRLVAFQMAG